MNSTVIISDSRGVGLQEQLEKKYNNVCVVKRGAGLETSVTAALTVIRATTEIRSNYSWNLRRHIQRQQK